jgi:rare lipoprotein A
MSTLRPHAVIPVIVSFSGIFVSASESPAAVRDRHVAGATTAIRHHAPNGRGAVQRTADRVTHQTEGSVARREPYQVVGHARHRVHPGPHLAEHDEVADEHARSFSGLASYYSEGQHVASGGTFDPSGFTCAHPTLPFGTHLRVADPKSGRSVVVTVNDRGPFVRGRVLDVSLGAARALGMTGHGVMRVEAHVI